MPKAAVSSFDTLRMWEGEQSRAFEEISYQLHKDQVPAGTRAIRTGSPDGGVEWYAVLPNGDEWGWQAKHVHGIDALLTAMTESVRRVAKERPNLRKLTFVISWNLGTSKQVRNGRQLKSQREKYDDKVTTWQQTIDGADKIAFELIQGSDVLDELAKPQHQGRRWFWWGDVVLGLDWLRSHHQQQADAAGEKYRPDLQVDIPIQEDLLAIGFDINVANHVRRLVQNVASAIAEMRSWPNDPDTTRGPLFENVKVAALALHKGAAALELQAGDPPSALADLATRLRHVEDAVDTVVQHERDAEAAWRAIPADDPRKQQQKPPEYRRSGLFRDVVQTMRALASWLGSPPGRALPRRAYFLTGEAGSGKTHLLLDATGRALDSGRPAVFLSGAQLGEGNLWASITDQLGLEPVGADMLLQAMDAAGEAAATCGSRFAIFIDALNETVPPDFWHRHLPALRAKVAQYPHVALVVSCRDTYRDLVLDDAERKHYLHRSHPGFADREVEATHTYFAHYGLEAPKIPLLTPEFTLPLFLRMYCESLGGAATTANHEGHLGRVTIFERYLAVKTMTVAARLTPDATSRYEREEAAAQVTRLLNALLDEMARHGSEGLTRAVAEAIARATLDGADFKPVKALAMLQEEGVLTRERLYLPNGTYGEGVRVVFQAFADFLLLKRRLSASDDPLKDPVLAAWLTNECSWGISEAATVLFPEAYGVELPDLLGVNISQDPVRTDDDAEWEKHIRLRQLYRSLVETLPYRASNAVTERTVALLNDAMPFLSDNDLIRTLFTLAPQPSNLLNGDRLHLNLALLSMPERDSSFGFATYHELFDESSPAARLARWAAAGPYPTYDPKVIELASIPLCWLLSSPNRYMRDWVTKALTQLLHGHLDVMRALVERFWTIDDPYIVQRVVAVAYGSLLRSTPAQFDHAGPLAETVHTLAFSPPVRADELLLDAARGITRWAVTNSLLPDSAQNAARRPYGLEPPDSAPSAESIEAIYRRTEDTPADQSYSSIYFSVLNLGDFGRYVIESKLNHFSRHPVGQPYPDRPDRTPHFDTGRWNIFVASLTPDQTTTLQDFLSAPDPHHPSISLLTYLLMDAPDDPLTTDQRDLLDAVWVYPEPVDDDYPSEPARRWVFQRTLDLGWKPQLFAAEDRMRGHGRGREGHKAERWGKKYQWMAWHELLARVADNYHAAQRYDDDQPYDGLHQLIGDREVDPSLPPIGYRTFVEDEGNGATAWQPSLVRLTEWPPANLDFTRYGGDIHRLLADTGTEPTLETSLLVRDSDQAQWVVLESYIKKIDPSGHKSWRGLQETSMVDTLLVPVADARKFLTAVAGKDRNSVLDLLDIHGHVDCCYLGEVGRTGPRCYHRHDGFETVEVNGKSFTIARTVEAYAWEGNIQDCSIGETAKASLPSTLMQQDAGLTFDMRGPVWIDPSGTSVFAYYQREGNDSQALLIRASYLRELLDQRKLELIVLLWYERMDLTGDNEGPFPSITVNAAARMGADLRITPGKPRRAERDLG